MPKRTVELGEEYETERSEGFLDEAHTRRRFLACQEAKFVEGRLRESGSIPRSQAARGGLSGRDHSE